MTFRFGGLSIGCLKRLLQLAKKVAIFLQTQNLTLIGHDPHQDQYPLYNEFTEGFDTQDLKDAKALLDELN